MSGDESGVSAASVRRHVCESAIRPFVLSALCPEGAVEDGAGSEPLVDYRSRNCRDTQGFIASIVLMEVDTREPMLVDREAVARNTCGDERGKRSSVEDAAAGRSCRDFRLKQRLPSIGDRQTHGRRF